MSDAALHQVSVYGVGHFGYAMLRHLAQREGETLHLRAFDREDEVRRSLREKRRHPFHDAPDPLPPGVEIVDQPEKLLEDVRTLVLAVTSDSTREVATRIAESCAMPRLTIVNTAKALDARSGAPLSEIVRESFSGSPIDLTYAAFSGGAIASDMLRRQPLGATLACERAEQRNELVELFASPSLWVEPSADVMGVQLAGAFKNLVSISAGMAEGLGFAFGVETHLISRLAGEIGEFCVRCLGASPATFNIASQCWGNDMWMSCTGPTRNRELGRLIGAGATLEEAAGEMRRQRKTVEGIETMKAMAPIFERFPDELRLLRSVRTVLLERRPAQILFDALMTCPAPSFASSTPAR